MSTARIRLSRIIALNWYGYRDIIDVRGLTLLCGETGTGKSALLDLIQFVLCPRTYKFNKAAAGESNARDLRGYCLADTSTRDRQSEQTRYVRRGGVTVAALEFEWPTTAASDVPRRETWGIRVAYESPTAAADYVQFFAPVRMGKESFCDAEGNLLDEDDFKTVIRQSGGESDFASHRGFIDEMSVPRHLNFDGAQMSKTLPKAIAFELEKDYESFVRNFILEPHPLDVANAKQSLDALHEMSARVAQLDEQRLILVDVAAADADYLAARREEAMFGHLCLELAHAEQQEKADAAAAELRTLESDHTRRVVELEKAKNAADAAEAMVRALRLSNGAEDPALTQLEPYRKDHNEKQTILADAKRQGGTLRTYLKEKARAWEKWLTEAAALDWKVAFDASLVVALRGDDLPAACAALQRSREAFQTIRQETGAELGTFGQETTELQQRLDGLQEEVTRIQEGRPRPTPLLDALLVREIKARSLGRVVEVSGAGEPWWGVIEKLLGDTREAVLLDTDADHAEAARLWASLPDAEPLLCAAELPEAGSPPERSLAALLECLHPLARRFLTMRLGRFSAVRTADDFPRHPAGAVTPDGLINDPPTRYRVAPEAEVSLGSKGLARLRQLKEVELARIRNELETKTRRQSAVHQWLVRGIELRLGVDDGPQTSLDQDQIDALECVVKELEERIEAVSNPDREERLRQIKIHQDALTAHTKSVGLLEGFFTDYLLDKPDAVRDSERAQEKALDSSIVVQENRIKLSPEILEAELVTRRQNALASPLDWRERRDDALKKASDWGSTATEHHRARKSHRLRLFSPEHASDYPDFDVEEESNERFDKRLADLNDHDLPKYKGLAREREIQWEERLQNDVLENLGNRLDDAGRTVGDFRQLFGQAIGTQRYSLKQWRNRSYEAVWKLIDASQNGESLREELFEYGLREKIAAAKRELMEAINDPAGLQAGEVLDYRKYHHYDLEMIPKDQPDDSEGAVSLQENVRKSSGGEGQAPFFVVMLGAFHRVYDTWQRTRQPSLGLVVMDEAFSKLSAGHIDDCLRLADSFGLQLVLAFPMDRLGAMIEHAESIIQCRVERVYDERSVPIQITNDVIYWDRERWLEEMV